MAGIPETRSRNLYSGAGLSDDDSELSTARSRGLAFRRIFQSEELWPRYWIFFRAQGRIWAKT
jgi:hypothetical protein